MEGAHAAAPLGQVTEQLNHHTAGSSDALPVHVLEFGGQAQQDTLQEIVKGWSVYEPAGYSQPDFCSFSIMLDRVSVWLCGGYRLRQAGARTATWALWT